MIQISYSQLPKSMNEDKDYHWAKQNRIKKKWQELTEDKLKHLNLKLDRVKVEIHIFFPVKRKRDVQNYMGSFAVKGILDGLVTSGLLSDDYWGKLKPYIAFHIDKKCPRTEVRIYEYS